MKKSERKKMEKELGIVFPQGKGVSTEEVKRMFINRPLEPHISFLACIADFMPVMAEMNRDISITRESIENLLLDTIQIINALEHTEDSNELKGKGFRISNADNISAIKVVLRDQIVCNYICILKKLETNPDYMDSVNEEFSSTLCILEEHPVFSYNAIYKGVHGGIHLDNIGLDEMKSRIQKQIKEIRQQIKDSEYLWVNEVLKILISRNATFNNQLFQDIYDFCEVQGFITEDQLKLHSSNSRPTAKRDYIRATYNRLINTEVYQYILGNR